MMLMHSARMTGAAVDKEAVIVLAAEMAPLLMEAIPYDALDAVYTRLITMTMTDPSTRSVMVNGHGFLSTWHTLQAEMAQARADHAEASMREYRAQAQEELRRKPVPTKHISELAKRDGVTLPWSPKPPGAPDSSQGPRRPGNWSDDTQSVTGPLEAPTDAEQDARENRNRAAWHRLAAAHENRLVNKTDKTKEEAQDNG